MSEYPYEQAEAGIRTFDAPLNDAGGMSARFIEIGSADAEYAYRGNYLLVLGGHCDIEGETFGEATLVVAKAVAPEPFELTAPEGSACLAMGVSF